VILLGAGVVWLLDAVGAISFSAVVVLPAALIAVGVAILILPGHHGGLIAIGIVLTLVLALTTSFDVKLEGGVGDQVFRPSATAELHRSYHLAMGQMTIDLTETQLSGTYRVDATVGLGQLTVRVPSTMEVHVHGHSGAGQVSAFGRQGNGIDSALDVVRAPQATSEGPAVVLYLDLRVGLGQISVSG
jgi:hypothetical protein